MMRYEIKKGTKSYEIEGGKTFTGYTNRPATEAQLNTIRLLGLEFTGGNRRDAYYFIQNAVESMCER